MKSESQVKVFISYSHQDAGYLEAGSLVGFLRGLERGGVEFWSDQRIATGERWDDRIRAEIVASDLALVLVSQAFLDSEYCTNVEIRGFLERARATGLVIFPVILSPCEWQRHDWLRERQFLPGGDETVEEHYRDPGRRKRLFLAIRTRLRELIERIRAAKSPAPRPGSGSGVASQWDDSSPWIPGSGERRQITVMHCELAPVAGGQPVDPEELVELAPAVRHLAARVTDRFGGELETEEVLSDCLTAHFGYPRAHEDDAQRAVHAAQELIREFALKRARFERDRQGGLTLRVGIHTGPGVVVRVPESGYEQLVLGQTANVAAAVQEAAGPDEVVVTGATERLIETVFHCEAMGSAELEDGRPPVALFRVIEHHDQSQVLAVGTGRAVQPVAREQELALLMERWRWAREGKGQVVLLRAEPPRAGSGKGCG